MRTPCGSVCPSVYTNELENLRTGFHKNVHLGTSTKVCSNVPNCGQKWIAVRDTADVPARVSSLTRTRISRLYQSDEYVG